VNDLYSKALLNLATNLGQLNTVIPALLRLGINRLYSTPELAWPYIY
jgi:hypothetical protein